jgi:hypothetical protein
LKCLSSLCGDWLSSLFASDDVVEENAVLIAFAIT